VPGGAAGRPAGLAGDEHREVRQALADPRLGNDPRSAALHEGPRWRPENLHNMLRADPPRHTRLRRLASAAFTARRVERLRPRISEVAGSLLDDLAAGPDPTDLVDRYAFPLPIIVICDLLGIPAAHRALFRDWTAAILRYATDQHAAAAIEAARDGIRDYLTALIAAKRASPADDLTSALIASRDDDGGLSETELLSTVSVLLTAGHETTANLIGNGMLALLRHPPSSPPCTKI
jgi:Cytochrome P450